MFLFFYFSGYADSFLTMDFSSLLSRSSKLFFASSIRLHFVSTSANFTSKSAKKDFMFFYSYFNFSDEYPLSTWIFEPFSWRVSYFSDRFLISFCIWGILWFFNPWTDSVNWRTYRAKTSESPRAEGSRISFVLFVFLFLFTKYSLLISISPVSKLTW